MQHMLIHDSDVTMNGHQGKVAAVDEDYDGEQKRTESWTIPSYTDKDLEDTLQAFQSLVDTIYARTPSQMQTRRTQNSLVDLVNGGDLESLPGHSFAYRRLSQAEVPSFKYVMPAGERALNGRMESAGATSKSQHNAFRAPGIDWKAFVGKN
ncbi:hypothetical protein QM012_001682 [Aureobasidium pullulans]|uniref:Uncharacterized protein n=1 Tax=Aureobasidium pullulans TaxID=5580 RepID=A0ABR0TFM9_AURPU